MSRQPSNSGKLNPAAMEQARGFLSSLFLGLRTAQTHEFSNRAFENATRLVFQSASQLFSTTGGFSIQFADSSALLNGQRLHVDGGTEQSLASLKTLLESGGLGGIEMRNPPTEAAMRKLILLFCSAYTKKPAREDADHALPQSAEDARTRTIRTYAKLVLAVRGEPVRAPRALQDLVDVAVERPDHLLRLSLNERGGTPTELHGVNSALVALVLGRALRLSRDELVQVGWATLVHHAGPGANRAGDLGQVEANISVIDLVSKNPVGKSMYLRAAVVGERCEPATPQDGGTAPHLFSRIAAVAVRYQQLVGGFATPDGRRLSPLEAVTRMVGDDESGLDRRLVDLLINLLRVYPVGTEVVLEGGESGIVAELGERWDRPVVRIEEEEPRTIDLGVDASLTIAGTRAFFGSGDRVTFDEEVRTPIFDAAQLAEIGVEPPPDPVTEPGLAEITQVTTAEVEPIPADFELPEPLAPGTEDDGNSATHIDAFAEDTAISEIDELKERIARRRRHEVEREKARRTSRIEHLAAQIAAYRAEREELADEASALEEDATSAERLAETVVARQGEVDRTLSEMAPAIAELEAQLDELWSRRHELADQATELEQRAEAARADARDAEEKAAEAEAEAKMRAERIAELEAELEQLRIERDDLERAADTFRNAAIEEARIAEQAEEQVEEIRREAQTNVPELTGNEEKLDAMKQRKLKLEAEKLALEQSAGNASAIARETRARVDEARSRIAEADEALAELEAELEKLRA